MTTNSWIQKTDFPDTTRGRTVSFSIGSKGYVCTGETHVGGFTKNFNDLWEYTSDSTTGATELTPRGFEFTINPNPAKDFITITLNP